MQRGREVWRRGEWELRQDPESIEWPLCRVKASLSPMLAEPRDDHSE